MKRILPIFAALFFSVLRAEEANEQVDFENQFNNDEIRALRDFVNTKRQVTVKERGGNLSIAGEVRTEYQAKSESNNGVRQYGGGSANPNKPSHGFDLEVNLMLDYRTDRNWAAVKLEFDNDMGTVSGTFSKIKLERAYLGGRLLSEDTYTMDTEVGRRELGNVFDSRIEFGSFMDGLLVKYDQALDWFGDVYVHGGPFIINDLDNQFGYVAEVGALNLFGTGLYTKYSFIDWDTRKHQNPITNERFRFRNSQVTLGYKFTPLWLERNITLYSAYLVNTAAQPVAQTHWRKANWGAYVGFSLGELRKKYDWSLDVNYQWVGPQAVPDFDASGYGRGNASGVGFYSVDISGGTTPVATTSQNCVGSNNFKGIGIQFLYNLTNTITLYQAWFQTVNLYDDIGPFIKYRQYELEVIYSY